MIDFFKEEELEVVKKQRKKVINWYIAIGVIYLVASIAIILWYSTLPYESPTITWVKVIHYSLSAIFVIFSFIYLGIVFKRVNKYFKLMVNMSTGIRETSTGSFIEYSESIQDKDGVDMKALIFLEWNKYKNDFFERKVLIPHEKDFPELTENVNARYITQSNVLISYEILS
jgi:hypothetical protein